MPGTTLQNGKYKIEQFLASGGFGCTYRGVHVLLNKRVAIKEFFVKDFCNRDETTGHVSVGTVSRKTLVEKLQEKFLKEAQSLCQFNHPGIVKVSDIFEENGTAYFIMDYIDGSSLKQILDKNGPMSEAEALRVMRQVADALREVHSKHRLHLDIKPGNIMIDRNNQAILIDFGASKQYDSIRGQNNSTLLSCTSGYASPEQMSQSVQHFHASTDIYSLGATLYKMVTGETPPDALSILSEGGIEIPTSVSPGVANAISKSMQSATRQRPQNVDEFLAILDGETDENTVIYDNQQSEDTELFDNPPQPQPEPQPQPSPTPAPNPTPTPTQKKQGIGLMGAILQGILIGVIVLGIFFFIASQI